MTDRLVPFPISWRKAIVDSDLSATVRHVALTLSMYMSELGDSAHPGATRLARDTRLHVSTVRAALAELVDGGWLALVEQGGRKGDRRRANTYAATMPSYPLPLVQADPSPESTRGPDRARPVVQDDPISSGNSPATPPNPPQAGGERQHRQESAIPERQALFVALADVTHTKPRTHSERRERGRRVDDLQALDATPDDVRARAAQWHRLNTDSGRRRWPTDRQLVRQWHVLAPPAPDETGPVCPDCENRGWVLPEDTDVAVPCEHPQLVSA